MVRQRRGAPRGGQAPAVRSGHPRLLAWQLAAGKLRLRAELHGCPKLRLLALSQLQLLLLPVAELRKLLGATGQVLSATWQLAGR